MRLIKLLSYAFLAVIASGMFGLSVGQCYVSIVSSPVEINKEALPHLFLVVAFSPETGKPELIKLFQYSAFLQEVRAEQVAAGYGLDQFLRDYGTVVFKEDEGKYSYAIDPDRIKAIESEVNKSEFGDLRNPIIEYVNIRLLSGQGTPDEQMIDLLKVNDDYEYRFLYKVSDGRVTPIAYGDVTMSKTGVGMVIMFMVFIFSMTVFVLMRNPRTQKQYRWLSRYVYFCAANGFLIIALSMLHANRYHETGLWKGFIIIFPPAILTVLGARLLQKKARAE